MTEAPRRAPPRRGPGEGPVRRTPTSLAARSLEVLREEGIQSLWFKVLGESVYRRVALFELPLDVQLPEPAPAVEAALGELGEADADEYAAFQPRVSAAQVRERLAFGHRCFLARVHGQLAHVSWAAIGTLSSAYLGRGVPLAPGEACSWETYTTPELRGLGLGPAVRLVMASVLRDSGYRRLLAAVLPENRPGIRLVEKLGYHRIGVVGYVRVGRWRRDFCRVSSGVDPPGAMKPDLVR
jgi:GNAT superfamily N-acetyltransferase